MFGSSSEAKTKIELFFESANKINVLFRCKVWQTICFIK